MLAALAGEPVRTSPPISSVFAGERGHGFLAAPAGMRDEPRGDDSKREQVDPDTGCSDRFRLSGLDGAAVMTDAVPDRGECESTEQELAAAR